MKRVVAWFFLFLLGTGGWVAFLLFSTLQTAEIFVDLPSGTNARSMATILRNSGVVRSQSAFLLLRLLKGGRLKAGEYRFAGTANTMTVYARIQRGDVYTRTVLIPEGYNLFDISRAVESSGLAQASAFLEAAHVNADLISSWAPSANSLEGFLFPDTYRFSRHTSIRAMQETMVKRFRVAADHVSLSKDIYRTVTFASLVEKEVRYDQEQSLVAGVFANRLAHSMPLQTDPSVIYAELLANRWTGTIHRSDLQDHSPYNTYLNIGLPPGPICSPGAAALAAAMHPANTNSIYFVADASGHTAFAGSLREHNRNVAAYRRHLTSSTP